MHRDFPSTSKTNRPSRRGIESYYTKPSRRARDQAYEVLRLSSTLGDKLLDTLELIERRLGDAVDQAEDFLAADRAHVDAELFRVGEIARVLVGCEERVLQRLGAVRRHARRCRKWPRQLIRYFENFDKVAVLGAARKLTRSRRVRKIGMPVSAAKYGKHAG